MNIGQHKPSIPLQGEDWGSTHYPRIGASVTFSMALRYCASSRMMRRVSTSRIGPPIYSLHENQTALAAVALAQRVWVLPVTALRNSPTISLTCISMVNGAPLVIKLLEGLNPGHGRGMARDRAGGRIVLEAYGA